MGNTQKKQEVIEKDPRLSPNKSKEVKFPSLSIQSTIKNHVHDLQLLREKEHLFFTQKDESGFLEGTLKRLVRSVSSHITKTEPIDIFSLPDEIIIVVLTFLEDDDIFRMLTLNKYFYDLMITNDEIIWNVRLGSLLPLYHKVPEKPKEVSCKNWYSLCQRSLFRFYPPLSSPDFAFCNNFSLAKHNSQQNGDRKVLCTPPCISGYYYVEVYVKKVCQNGNNICIGVSKGDSIELTGYLGSSEHGIGYFCLCKHVFQGTGLNVEEYNMGDTIGILVDMNQGCLSFFKNNKYFYYRAGVFSPDSCIRISLSTLYHDDEYQLIYHPYPQFTCEGFEYRDVKYLDGVNKWFQNIAGVQKKKL